MPAPQKRPKGGCDALSQHMRAIGRIPLLTAEEEISMARLVQRGCRATASKRMLNRLVALHTLRLFP